MNIPDRQRGRALHARGFFVLLLSVFWLASQAAGPQLSPERFTEEFAAALKTAAPDYSVTVAAPLEVHIKGPNDAQATAYLDNAYSEYRRNPESKKQVIERYMMSLIDTATISDRIDPERIVPVIKDRAWAHEAGKAGGGEKDGRKLVVDDFNADLVIVYAEDSERNIRYFSPEQFERSGIERGVLRSVAIENLRRLLPQVKLHAGDQFSMLTAGDDYVPSLLLLDDLWSGGRLKVEGEIVVAVPSRDLLLFTGSANKKGVSELRRIAVEAAAESTYALTERLFVYRKGRFERFDR